MVRFTSNVDIHFELELSGQTYRFPDEAALVRFLHGLRCNWSASDEVRLVRSSDGVY